MIITLPITHHHLSVTPLQVFRTRLAGEQDTSERLEAFGLLLESEAQRNARKSASLLKAEDVPVISLGLQPLYMAPAHERKARRFDWTWPHPSWKYPAISSEQSFSARLAVGAELIF